ncbi:MAG: dephospho-CoA kinase [candidate division WS1 bacterium]|jgi:dephospho-CoA kinase|nr:dephospho-CoA kinase [candidate division WS1 bacterium]
MRVIGIIGPIASGKSVVIDELKRLGAAIVLADEVSRELLRPGNPLLEAVFREFGARFRRDDGTLDRRGLGAEIAGDDEARERLERLMHPAMVARMAEMIASLRDDGVPFVALEAANLVPMGGLALVDMTLLVDAPRAERIRRLMERDGMSRERAESFVRLHERLGIGGFPATYRLITSGDRGTTREKVQRLWCELVQ